MAAVHGTAKRHSKRATGTFCPKGGGQFNDRYGITSLFLIFFKQRWGKFLFMIFTILLVAIQYQTIYPPAWWIYIIELVILLIIAPLRVISKFTERIQTETQKINPFKDKDKK